MRIDERELFKSIMAGFMSGYRPRRFDTRMGTMYLVVSKLSKETMCLFL